MIPKLFLHEELMLLALSDERGTIESGVWYLQATSAAVLSELMMAERVRIQGEGRSAKLEVIRTDLVGNDLIDEWLSEMAKAGKPQALQNWITKINGTKDLKGRVTSKLVEQGILEKKEGRVLWIFNRTTYPEVDGSPEVQIRERLRTCIFTDTNELDARTIALLSIANSSGILQVLFDKKELKARKERIDQIVEGELAGAQIAQQIAATNMLLMTTCIIPIIIT